MSTALYCSLGETFNEDYALRRASVRARESSFIFHLVICPRHPSLHPPTQHDAQLPGGSKGASAPTFMGRNRRADEGETAKGERIVGKGTEDARECIIVTTECTTSPRLRRTLRLFTGLILRQIFYYGYMLLFLYLLKFLDGLNATSFLAFSSALLR